MAAVSQSEYGGRRQTKVQILFTDSLTQPPASASVQKLIHVIIVPWPFDFSAYLGANRQAKKEAVGIALLEAFLWLSDLFGWDKQPFQVAHSASQDAAWECTGFSKKSWNFPSGNFRARIFFRFDLDAVELFAVLYKRRSKVEIARKRLGTGVPEMGCLHSFLRTAKWSSEKRFGVFGTDSRQQKWHADFPETAGQ